MDIDRHECLFPPYDGKQLDDPSFDTQCSSLWYDESPPTSTDEQELSGIPTPIPFSTLPFGLSLSDIDIDMSIHKLLEDLPEIRVQAPFQTIVSTESLSTTTPRPQENLPITTIPEPVLEATPPHTHQTHQVVPVNDIADVVRRPELSSAGKSKRSSSVIIAKNADASWNFGVVPNLVEGPGGAMICHSRKLLAQDKMKRGSGCSKRTKLTQQFLQADHIFRERLRRDDMADKFITLGSLLPSRGSRRDRTSIVEETMTLLKDMQHRKEELVKRRSQLQQAIPSAVPSLAVKLSKPNQLIATPTTKLQTIESGFPSSSAMDEEAVPESDISKRQPVSRKEVRRQDSSEILSATIRKSMKSLRCHSDVPDEIVLELICQPRPKLHSNVLEALESLNLEVIRCSITKINRGLTICNIIVRVQRPPGQLHVETSANMIRNLESFFSPA